MATNDHGSYAGKVAFVTGAASGIGTPEGHAAVIAQEPIGRMGTLKVIAAAILWLC
jgi:NAD(P)-dependent dehydrogenase (short-subunit alcohol dehydrogenase family)